MWNVLGAALVLGAAGMSGFVVARSYSDRPAVLRGLQGALTMLLTEIRYGATLLPDALVRIARHSPPPVDEFLFSAGAYLSNDGLSTATAWRRAVTEQRGRWCLTNADEAVLLDLAGYIGQTFADHQENHIRLALVHLRRQEEEAAADAGVQSKLWRYLGVCAGGLLVLLFY